MLNIRYFEDIAPSGCFISVSEYCGGRPGLFTNHGSKVSWAFDSHPFMNLLVLAD